MKSFYQKHTFKTHFRERLAPLLFCWLYGSGLGLFAQAPSCDCVEYVYLNEPAAQKILKFEVNPSAVPLTEILVGGTHWYPGTYGSNIHGMNSPHGIAADQQGYIYVGETGVSATNIRRFTCDGEIFPTTGPNSFAIANTGQKQNFFAIGNTLYNNAHGGPNAWNTCTQAFVGQAVLNDLDGNAMPTTGTNINLWGLSYNPVTEMVYATARHGGAANVPASRKHLVWAFTRAQLEDAIENGTRIDPILGPGPAGVYFPPVGSKYTPNTPESLFGIVSDNSGNMYIVKSVVDSLSGASKYTYILKYNAAGEFVAHSPVDSVTGIDPANGIGGYRFAIGMTYSETTNRLYVSNFTDNMDEDCISVFDAATMNYLGVGAPNPGFPAIDDRGKAIGIIRECCPVGCPTADTLAVVNVGDKLYLSELIGGLCSGTVCGASWVQDPDNVGFVIDECDNSITITEANTCGTFSLAGTSSRCGALCLELNLCTVSPVSVGDYAWIDLDGDGLQNDPYPLQGMKVTIYDAATQMPVTVDIYGDPYTSTQTTDASGAYLFSDLAPGNYYVVFDRSMIPNADLYDFTTPNALTNTQDVLDSDAQPSSGTEAVSSETGMLPGGTSYLRLDAGVRCNLDVVVNIPVSVCTTKPVQLDLPGSSITPASLGGLWSSSGDGVFMGGTAFGAATQYVPGPNDKISGTVTLTLTTNNPGDLMPASPCTPVSESVTVEILQVNCGNFPWGG